jgi:hypothetical protein
VNAGSSSTGPQSTRTTYRSTPRHLQLLRAHPDTFGTGRDGRVFVGPRGGIFAEWIYLDVYSPPRRAAFTDEETESQLAETPYALSARPPYQTWLHAGVGPTSGR